MNRSKILSNKVASLFIDNEKYTLIPNKMEKYESGYVLKTSGLEIMLELNFICENAFTTMLRIKNTAKENSSIIRNVSSFDVDLETENGSAFWRGCLGDSHDASTFLPQSKLLQKGETFHREPVGGRSSNTTAFPFFDISVSENKTYVFGIGWSGQWKCDIINGEKTFNTRVGLCDCNFYLLPDEAVRFPLTLVFEGGELYTARNGFRDLLRDKLSPQASGDVKMPIAIQPFDRYFPEFWRSGQKKFEGDFAMWASESGQIKEAELAAKCKYVDTVWLDAAWFKGYFERGIGNYDYFTDGFPNGLKNVSDCVRKNGMQFLVWFEPERVGKDTQVERDIPEYLLHIPDEKHALLNLGNEAARKYITETIINFIEKNGVDFYRQDFNIDPLEYWRRNDGENRCGTTEMHYIEGLYKFWDDLKAHFPKLQIDDCCAGGRRIDLETVKRAVMLWRSDTACHAETDEKPKTVWNNIHTLSLNRYVPFTQSAVFESNAYEVRSAATGGVALAFDILRNQESIERINIVTEEIYRTRPFWKGRFYPLTDEDCRIDNWTAYQLCLKDKGIAYFFRKKMAEENSCTVNFFEINENKNYRLKITDENYESREATVSGKVLKNGYTVTMEIKRSSMLIEYSLID